LYPESLMKTQQLAKVDPWDMGAPAINGPDLTGASIDKPFFYAIPVTGERPLTFRVEGLPEGLRLDPRTGFITGAAKQGGDHRVLLQVENQHGKAEKEFDIAIGRGLALTPPLGWNSWNAWRRWVDDGKVRAAAKAMVDSGLAARGYTYINVDSCWQGQRGGAHNAIQPNCKFPDMKALASHIHGRGLKFGIYSTPWVEPWGCSAEEAKADWGGGALIGSSAGEQDPEFPRQFQISGKFTGKEKFEPNDVAQWVEWGVDFLKYDWVPTDPVSLERMGRPLKAAPRDIIFSVCTDAKLKWADAYMKWTEMWRSIPDTYDEWPSVVTNGFFSDDTMGCEDWRPLVRPGKWNDLDMTALGPQFDTMTTTRANHLTPEEQLTHMTLWALYPSPLILSCALDAISDFELRLFGNVEVLAVNQDRLGKVATRVREERTRGLAEGGALRNFRIHARPLSDGSLAVGVFNLSGQSDMMQIWAKDLGLSGRFAVRNLWERRDMGKYEERVDIEVPAHGAQMLKIQK
ncbi:MAG: glycoside hydrolase family 27 protein, partial [bacterium]